ncbi:adenosylcobinamide kinase /adenosylcobinamide-phosphate guanylyltransferase [Peptoclostridium litorale DSM 5388]|uniref:Adenosylcobinamide kinase n=1 Tax=Peptoclostridium litorale DSM 5388 TaxID=1121324 RepID=A0A069RQQ3_PEPLI|nr:bifunctional adenosylcobinamide kinase/adenosylcobinamide-phosphate guanylyltransferase [Peptoclostridium litorale]KDR96507.1 bifunctional adenosylcobalamin biosynthesis protein CobU [Peptoclostridium litorale DSM 5388]SIN69788.1 adenosylcobinamide kinase /adenosylcobinamide-phosphate guanylyltransferase [Peptoclostridium litorale DSM 5388]
MGKIIMVTGGARSGKSRLAEKIAADAAGDVAYVATAIAFDDGMKDRIKKHRNSRPSSWKTYEIYKGFESIKEDIERGGASTVLLDCITVMVTNIMLETGVDFDSCSMEEVDNLEAEIFKEVNSMLDVLSAGERDAVIVTNEVGMGLVPSYRLGSIFRDIAGRVNQHIAAMADEVHVCFSGIPMRIK